MSDRPRSRWIERLEELPASTAMALVAVLVVLVGIADSLTAHGVPFTLVYMVPIALAAWRLGKRALLATVLSCGVSWLVIELQKRRLAMPPAMDALSLLMELGVFLSFGFALTALRSRFEAVVQLARTDPLTGVANRRAFWTELGREIERCRRFGGPFSVAYLDVDGFKSVNDRRGHRIGDELLQAMALTLTNGVRRVDLVARLGGDEFALLLPGTDELGAKVVLRKVQAQLNAGLLSTFQVACSAGCLTVLDPSAGTDQVIAQADQLMYEAKHLGRGSLCSLTLAPDPVGSRHRLSTG